MIDHTHITDEMRAKLARGWTLTEERTPESSNMVNVAIWMGDAGIDRWQMVASSRWESFLYGWDCVTTATALTAWCPLPNPNREETTP